MYRIIPPVRFTQRGRAGGFRSKDVDYGGTDQERKEDYSGEEGGPGEEVPYCLLIDFRVLGLDSQPDQAELFQ